MMSSCRAQLCNVWRTSADLIKERRRKFNTCLVRNRCEVQNGVGRSADPHIDRNSILKSLTCHNIARADIFFDKIKDDSPCLFCKQTALPRIRGRYRSIAGKSHTEYLRQGVHRICGEQTGTGAAARAGVLLNGSHFTSIHFPCSKHAGCLKGLADTDVAPAVTPRKHRPSANKDGRNIEASRRHEHSGNDLITVWNKNKAVKPGRHCNGFNRVRNQLTARK